MSKKQTPRNCKYCKKYELCKLKDFHEKENILTCPEFRKT